MRNRLLVLLCMLGLLVTVAGVAALLLLVRDPITRASYAKIQPGMSKGEVEHLLGGPARLYAAGAVGFWEELPVPPGFEREPGPESGFWAGAEGEVVVGFDGSGRVWVARFRERPPEPRSTGSAAASASDAGPPAAFAADFGRYDPAGPTPGKGGCPMQRAIVVVVSTLLFAVLGLVIGLLVIVTGQKAGAGGGRVTGGDLLVSYVVAPVVGGVIGLALAVIALKIAGPPK